ncbi:MAG: tetratricopeptide repeat protein [Alkalinema sp. RU_4_3]|nr:tetratricopeptide repeat protein [Alkalinema sp. RU_4_3]
MASWVVMAEGAIAQTTIPGQSEVDRLESLGKQQQQQALYSAARETFEKLVKLRREMGDRAGEAAATEQLAKVYRAMGLIYKELESYQSTLKLFQELKNQRGEVNTLIKIAQLYYLRGSYQEALNTCQTVLAIPNISSQRSSMSHVLIMMAAIYQQQGNLDQALEKVKQGLQTSPQPQSNELLLAASIYSDLGNFQEAIDVNQGIVDTEIQRYNNYNYSRGVTVRGIRYLCKEYQALKSLDIDSPNFQDNRLEKSIFSTTTKLSAEILFPLSRLGANNQINMIYSNNLSLTGALNSTTRSTIGLGGNIALSNQTLLPEFETTIFDSQPVDDLGRIIVNPSPGPFKGTGAGSIAISSGDITVGNIRTTFSFGGEDTREITLSPDLLNLSQFYLTGYSIDAKNAITEAQMAECSEPSKIPVGHRLNLWREPIQSAAASTAYTVSTALNNLGAIYRVQGNPTEALKLFLEADTWAARMPAGLSRSTILGNIATLSLDLDDLSEAKENARKSLQLAEQEGPLQLAQAYQVSGRIYSLAGDNATAILLYKKALAIANNLNSPSSKALSMIAIGNSYSDRGDFTQSLSFLNQALKIAQGYKLLIEEIQALDSLGIVYRLLGQFDRALDLQKQALRLSQDIGTIPNIVSIMTGIASLHYEKGEFAIAEKPTEKPWRSQKRPMISFTAAKFILGWQN